MTSSTSGPREQPPDAKVLNTLDTSLKRTARTIAPKKAAAIAKRNMQKVRWPDDELGTDEGKALHADIRSLVRDSRRRTLLLWSPSLRRRQSRMAS